MKRKLVVFLVFSFYNLFVFSQLKDSRTDSLSFAWGDYYFLNSIYEKSIQKYKSTEDNLSIDRLRNLANSYVMVNNLGEALDIYEKITKSNNANVLDYYNYANLLPKESKLAKEYREKATKLSIGITNSMDVNNKNLPHEYYLKNLSVNSGNTNSFFFI